MTSFPRYGQAEDRDVQAVCFPPDHACGGCFACTFAGREPTGAWRQLLADTHAQSRQPATASTRPTRATGRDRGGREVGD